MSDQKDQRRIPVMDAVAPSDERTRGSRSVRALIICAIIVASIVLFI